MKLTRIMAGLAVICLLATLNFAQTHRRSYPRRIIPVQRPITADVSNLKRLPINYSGDDPIDVYTAIHESALEKSQFETIADYRARTKKVLSQIKLQNGKRADETLTIVISELEESYDAEKQQITLKLSSNDESLGDDFSKELLADDLEVNPIFFSIDIISGVRSLGTGIGQNAFGVKRRIQINKYTSIRLSMRSDLFTTSRDTVTFRIAPFIAQRAAGYVRLAFNGKLHYPFFGEYSYSDTATLSDPEEARNFRKLIFFEPDSLVAYNKRTGEILASATLPAQQNRDSSSDNNSIVLLNKSFIDNDPKLIEAEANPDRVFTASEVSIKAKVIQYPNPTHPDNSSSYLIPNALVKLRLVLSRTGEVTNIEVLQGQPSGLTEKAIEAAKKIQFVPAQIDGREVSQVVIVKYTFNRD